MRFNALVIGNSDIGLAVVDTLPGSQIISRDVCDVRDVDCLAGIFERTSPSVVVNCAGTSSLETILQSTPEKWADEIAVNLFGSYAIAKAAAITVPKATLVFISSVAGLYGKPGHSGYSAAKAGVRSLVQSLSMEGFNAFAVSPGRVDTKMRDKDYPGENPNTRLTTKQVAEVVRQCVDGKYDPGDNVVIRKKGTKTLVKVDSGKPWKDYLNVKPLGSLKRI